MESPVSDRAGDPAEGALRDKLARGDAMIGAAGPILRHLLANDDHSLFGDEIVARVRGLLDHVAQQLLAELHRAGGGAEPEGDGQEGGGPENDGRRAAAALHANLRANPAMLGHAHALALEWQLTERLHARLGLDPVLSPLMQALLASSEPAVSSSAMSLLASQARFGQAQRRMQVSLRELPGDLLHGALMAMRGYAAEQRIEDSTAARAEAAIRSTYDESRSRLGLIARTVTAMGGGATAALSITHAGVAIFVSALALALGQDRDMAILATNEGQAARLALALRATGLKAAAIEELFLALHPDSPVPDGIDRLGADRAALLLAQSLTGH